jgi:hypothetical protein
MLISLQAKVYVLKQCWQRLPGLGPEPKTAQMRNVDNVTPEQPNREELIKQFGDIDKKPFEETVMERAGWMGRLKKSWMVELDGKPITTFDTIRKNHATSYSLPQRYRKYVGERLAEMSSKPGTPTRTGTSAATRTPARTKTPVRTGTSATSGPKYTMQNTPNHPALVTRTLVRLVFDRPGWPIERFMSKRELLEAVKMIVKGNTYPYTSDHTC